LVAIETKERALIGVILLCFVVAVFVVGMRCFLFYGWMLVWLFGLLFCVLLWLNRNHFS
jgi:hypothetical protein